MFTAFVDLFWNFNDTCVKQSHRKHERSRQLQIKAERRPLDFEFGNEETTLVQLVSEKVIMEVKIQLWWLGMQPFHTFPLSHQGDPQKMEWRHEQIRSLGHNVGTSNSKMPSYPSCINSRFLFLDDESLTILSDCVLSGLADDRILPSSFVGYRHGLRCWLRKSAAQLTGSPLEPRLKWLWVNLQK